MIEKAKKEMEIYRNDMYVDDLRKLLRGCEWSALGEVSDIKIGKNKPFIHIMELVELRNTLMITYLTVIIF